MTDRELMQQWLQPGAIVPVDTKTVRILLDALRERLAQPQRTHWEGCEAVHPECKQPEQEESEAVRAAWMAGYTEGEREAIENQTVHQQEPFAWIDESAIRWLADRKGKTSAHCTTQLSAARSFEKPMPIYTAPPRREWVGLTDEEKAELDAEYGDDTLAHLEAIEAKLREKNNG